jgi:anti-sigma factor (TIGR02949 family)
MTSDKGKPAVEEIDCLEAIDNLYAYLDGELEDQAVLEKFEAHLGHCRSCYSRAGMEKALNRRIEKSGSGEPPESLQHRLRDLIDKL